MKIRRATLIAKIPEGRFRSIDGSVPEVSDIIVLDQGFTFPEGKSGGGVYGIGQDGKYSYEAEVYEVEIGDDIDT